MPDMESQVQNSSRSSNKLEGVSPRVAEMMKKADEGYAKGLEKKRAEEERVAAIKANLKLVKQYELAEKQDKAAIAYVREMEKLRSRELSEALAREARDKRNELFEGRGMFKMSKEDFQTYFASKEFDVRAEMSQGNVGDCYAVAAIHALSCSPHYEMIVRSSMKRLPDGSWEVRIPLLDENAEVVKITQEEIQPQKNEEYPTLAGALGSLASFVKPYAEFLGFSFDTRKLLRPLSGKEGLQVLEAAFIKSKFKSVDRLAAEGGLADEALKQLGGEKFIKATIRADSIYKNLDSLPKREMLDLNKVLENFDPEVYIATASTKQSEEPSKLDWLKASNGLDVKGTSHFFYYRHAYSVSKIDQASKVITIANPWDTATPIVLTFEQFKQSFNALRLIRVDSAKMLQNMKAIVEKAA